MFHTFTPAEGKIEKKEFESAENIFTTFLVTALAMIGASAASDETKQLAKELVEADCRSVTALEKRGDTMIQRGNNPTDKKLWTDIKDIKENAPCSRDVLAGTTYSGIVSPSDYSDFVSPSDIGETMTREQMQKYIANEENKKIEEQHAEEEAKQLKVQKEHEAQRWMLHLFRNSPSALVNIIKENAQKNNWNTVEQAEFWRKKHEAVEKYLEARKKTKEKKEAVEKYIIDVIFGGVKLFAGAILAAVGIDELKRRFKPMTGETLKTLEAKKTKREAEKREQQRDEEKKKEVEKAKTKREDDDSKKEHESSDDSDDDSEYYDPERDMVMDENGDWRKDH